MVTNDAARATPTWRSVATLGSLFLGLATPAGCVEDLEDGALDRGDVPAEVACGRRYFEATFDVRNPSGAAAVELRATRDEALAALELKHDELRACGASVSLGALVALLDFESALQVGSYNTRCEENAYVRQRSGCDADPEAMYSYQYGLGAMHTSNFHPCKGGAWTQKMRRVLSDALADAGFDVSPASVDAVTRARFATICPGRAPEAIDRYLLRAHDAFGIPRDASGNLAGGSPMPLLDPGVSIALTLEELNARCAAITSDRVALAVFGGSDGRYATRAFQDKILGRFQRFAASVCR
jgi:hypothetical protein